MNRAWLPLALAASLISTPGTAQQTPACGPDCQEAAMTASVNAAKQGRYMQAAFGLLDQLGVQAPEQIEDPDIFDQWSQVWSAMTAAPYPNRQKPPYSHISKTDLAALQTAQARPAIAEIVARARRTRVVILDEDHLSPRDRLFGLEVARALRPLGYRILAVETLTRDRDDAVAREKMARISRDGYLRRSNGYYINDPVFADFLRQALRLGFTLIPYESAGFTDEADAAQRSDRREQEMAENIARRALADPNARVLVYGGRHHAAKAPIDDPAVSEHLWMAERLKRLTGIDPLVVDQVELGAMPSDRPDANLYGLAARYAPTQSMVLMRHGKPLVVGLLAGGADLQVVHPAARTVGGRPDWLRRLGRKPVPAPWRLRPRSGVRLVQAFLTAEADDTIPIDQVLVRAGEAAPRLMLPDAPIRYSVQERPAKAASQLPHL